jgi:hypothetical protein
MKTGLKTSQSIISGYQLSSRLSPVLLEHALGKYSLEFEYPFRSASNTGKRPMRGKIIWK